MQTSSDRSFHDPSTAALPRLVEPATLQRRPSAATLPRSTAHCDVSLDHDPGALWIRLRPECPSKFTPDLLGELRGLQDRIAAYLHEPHADRTPRYQVMVSDVPGVFSLGGDLALFRDCIQRQDAITLRRYAMDAVDLVHANATGYGHALTTIALVRGQALGGGFEAALSAHVLIAERGSKMGLPEVLFNMFPGMGAWQFLSRRVGPAEAERIILGGRTYRAEELHALGVVDVLAEPGEGEAAVTRWIRSHDRQHHARAGFRRAVDAADPLDRGALHRMAEVWVETALGLGERDLATIDYLLRAQRRMAMKIELERTPAELLKKA